MKSVTFGGVPSRKDRGLDVEGDLDPLANCRVAGQRLAQAELGRGIVGSDFDRRVGFAKEAELLPKCETGDEWLG